MSDSFWKYSSAEGRQQQQQQQQQQQPLLQLIGKRPRSDYDLPGGRDLPNYFAREDERGTQLVVKDSDSIGASYDRYLRGTQFPPYGGIESARPLSTGFGGRLHEDPRMLGLGLGVVDPVVAATTKSREAGLMGARPEITLPPDASNTLFVEGLPADCSRREVSQNSQKLIEKREAGLDLHGMVDRISFDYIFRPFVGYKEVRLVTKESRHSSGDPLVLCFVDFESPAEAATAKDALQGYKFDEHERDTPSLRLQFARYPGARSGSSAARSGGGIRGRR